MQKEKKLKPNLKRLRKLFTAKHGLDKFDFGVVAIDPYDCGSVGCKMGDLPNVFPRSFRWTQSAYSRTRFVRLTRNSAGYMDDDVMEFFGLTQKQYLHLFVPAAQSYGRRQLTKKARLTTVNANGLDFCDRVERGEITD